jgi:hypothetical protein
VFGLLVGLLLRSSDRGRPSATFSPTRPDVP